MMSSDTSLANLPRDILEKVIFEACESSAGECNYFLVCRAFRDVFLGWETVAGRRISLIPVALPLHKYIAENKHGGGGYIVNSKLLAYRSWVNFILTRRLKYVEQACAVIPRDFYVLDFHGAKSRFAIFQEYSEDTYAADEAARKFVKEGLPMEYDYDIRYIIKCGKDEQFPLDWARKNEGSPEFMSEMVELALSHDRTFIAQRILSAMGRTKLKVINEGIYLNYVARNGPLSTVISKIMQMTDFSDDFTARYSCTVNAFYNEFGVGGPERSACAGPEPNF